MKVVSVPLPGPVGFFRGVAPMGGLAARGHAAGCVHEKSGHSREEIAEMIEEADVVSVNSFGRMFEKRSTPFKNMRGVLVYDLDDNYWAWDEDPGSKDPKTAAVSKRYRADITPERLAEVESWLRNVDLVTTTTEALAEILREHGAREVAVCRNGLGAGFQRHSKKPRAVRTGSVLDRVRRSRRAFDAFEIGIDKRIGWSGQIVHKADLSPVLEALRLVMGVDPSVGCLSLGPASFVEQPEWKREGFRPRGYRQVLVEIAGKPAETVPFELYYPTLESMNADVAVVPLRPSPFNLPKSDVTLLSWAIQGVPVVCSRTGPYALAELEGFPAVYVDHGDVAAWTFAIRGLLYDRPRAAELAERAKAWVLERRCFPAAAEPWERAYEAACRKKGVEFAPAKLERLNGGAK